jgi:hypothetical protein
MFQITVVFDSIEKIRKIKPGVISVSAVSTNFEVSDILTLGIGTGIGYLLLIFRIFFSMIIFFFESLEFKNMSRFIQNHNYCFFNFQPISICILRAQFNLLAFGRSAILKNGIAI